jgi:hypothetical protein
MKGLLVGLSLLALAGCASGWDSYSDANNCQPTEKTTRKAVANPFSTTSYAGPVPMNVPGMDLRYQPYRLYHCSNGPIWGPITTDSKE